MPASSILQTEASITAHSPGKRSSISCTTMMHYLAIAVDKTATQLGVIEYAIAVDQRGLSRVSPYMVPDLKPAPLSFKTAYASQGDDSTTGGFRKRSVTLTHEWMALSSTVTAGTYKGAKGC